MDQIAELTSRRRTLPQRLKDYDVCDIDQIDIEIDPSADYAETKRQTSPQASHLNHVLKCSQCDKILSSKQSLEVHMKLHEKTRPFRCTHSGCVKAFTTKDFLKQHIKTHSGVKPYTCKTCDRGFSAKNALREHESLHTGEKLYTCHHCSAQFRQMSVLTRHMTRHSNDKGKFVCSLCGKTFKMNIYLKSHMKSHTGERPFSCDVCRKAFAHRSDLNRHKIIHTGEKPYKCHVCSARFNDSSSRRRHEREHDSAKPYYCEYCSESFKRPHHLKNHVARKHYIYTEQIIGSAIGTKNEDVIQFPLSSENNTSSLLKSVANKLHELPVLLNGQRVTLLSVQNTGNIGDKKDDVENVENLEVDIEETSEISALDALTLKTENRDDIENEIETVPMIGSENEPTNDDDDQSMDFSITSQGIVQRVTLPKLDSQIVALDPQVLLEKVKNKIITPKEDITISCNIVEESEDHQIMEVHFHNVHPKPAVKSEPANKNDLDRNSLKNSENGTLFIDTNLQHNAKGQSLFTETLESMEQNVVLPQSSEMPIASLSNAHGDTVLYLAEEENSAELLTAENALLTSEETKRYSANADFTSQEYYNWLSAYCDACKSLQIPLTVEAYKTISKVLSDLTNVMVNPTGVLANKENFKILMNISKDFSNIIEKHLEHVLSSLND